MSAAIPAMGALPSRWRQACATPAAVCAALALACLLMLALDVTTGPAALGWRDLLMAARDPGQLDEAQRVILLEYRLPCALMALLVGWALGQSGAEMQTALNNPLASPFTLGLSAASSVGATLVVLSGWHWTAWDENLALTAGAFGGSLVATALVVWLAWWRGAGVQAVVLFGIGLLFSFEALLWMLQYLADSQSLQQIVFWTMGSLGRSTWPKLAVLGAVCLLAAAWSARDCSALTLLRAGEEQARSLGVPVGGLRLGTLVRVSLVSATALSFVGTIGFVGLVGPHIARLCVGEDHRHFLPASALAGALLVSGASVLSKSLLPGAILPIGVVTALLGVPLLMALLLRQGPSRHE